MNYQSEALDIAIFAVMQQVLRFTVALGLPTRNIGASFHGLNWMIQSIIGIKVADVIQIYLLKIMIKSTKQSIAGAFVVLMLVLGLFAYFFAYSSEPALSKMTCRQYWDHHKKMVDIHSAARAYNEKKFISEHSKLWDYHIQKFNKDYPDLSFSTFLLSEAKDFKGQPFYIMAIYAACEMRPENMEQNLGKRIQETLYRSQIRERQEKNANDNGCRFDTVEIDPHGNWQRGREIAYLCMQKGWSKSFGKEESGKKFRCYDYSKNGEQCYELVASRENACLGQFGSCRQSSEGECSWTHTEKSHECLD